MKGERNAHEIRIELIRHFMTPGNQKKRYIGTTDEPILPQGIPQEARRGDSRAAGRAVPQNAGQGDFRAEDGAERLFVSPMKRCIQTAEILYPGKSIEPVEDFRECDFGEFENKNYLELSGNPLYQAWIDSGGRGAFPGGERPDAFRERCAQAFEGCVDRLVREHIRSAAMVVHGGTVMAVMEAFGWPKRDFYSWHVGNGRGYRLSCDGEKWARGEKKLLVRGTI